MPTVDSIGTHIEETPLVHPFATAQDKLDRQVSRCAVITVRLDDGREAVGEAVPVHYVTGETHDGVQEAVAAAASSVTGADAGRLRPMVAAARAALPEGALTARAGIEIALFHAWCLAVGTTPWRALGGAARSVITDLTLALGPGAEARAREAADYPCLKMKVGGGDVDAEVDRVAAVQRAVPDKALRLDANQAYTPDAALALIRGVLRAGVNLELVEQPVAKDDLAGLDRVSAASPVPIIADEAVRTPADAIRVVTETRAHGVNVKLMKAGIAGALDIIGIARAARRKLMIGCMLETRRGIAISVALACGTGAFDYVDLDSHVLLKNEAGNLHFDSIGPRLAITEV